MKTELITSTPVGIWPAVFRAIEIAKTGGHTVSVYFDPHYKAGFEDYKTIKTFCKGWFEDFASGGDIVVEMQTPQLKRIGRDEPISAISGRIYKALQHPKPNETLNPYSELILSNAMRVLNLPISSVERVVGVASTIARLGLCKNIEAIHIAEAIGYTHSNWDGCDAESEYVNFGGMIAVKNCTIDSENIQKAIEYLKGFL